MRRLLLSLLAFCLTAAAAPTKKDLLNNIHRVLVLDYQKGGIRISPNTQTTAPAARANLREALHGKSLEEIAKALSPAEVLVWDAKQKKHLPVPLENAAPVALLAMSFPAETPGARQVFLGHEDELHVVTLPSQSLENLNATVEKVATQSGLDAAELRPRAPETTEAVNGVVEVGKDSVHVDRSDEKVQKVSARLISARILRNPEFQKNVLSDVTYYRGFSKHYDPKMTLSRPTVEPLWKDGLGELEAPVQEQLSQELKAASKRCGDLSHMGTVQIHRRPVRGGDWVIYNKDGKHPRLGLILQGDPGNELDSACCKSSGCDHIAYVNNLDEAAAEVKKFYEKNGKTPIDLICNSHGTNGYMNFFSRGRGDLDRFITLTGGMLHEVATMGCSVATNPATGGHLMRRLAVGTGARIVGVDRLLMLEGNRGKAGKYTVGGPGHSVTVSPKVPANVFPATQD